MSLIIEGTFKYTDLIKIKRDYYVTKRQTDKIF